MIKVKYQQNNCEMNAFNVHMHDMPTLKYDDIKKIFYILQPQMRGGMTTFC